MARRIPTFRQLTSRTFLSELVSRYPAYLSHFDPFPGKFSVSGNEFIVGSNNHPHYFVYDMMVGKSIKVARQLCKGSLSLQFARYLGNPRLENITLATSVSRPVAR